MNNKIKYSLIFIFLSISLVFITFGLLKTFKIDEVKTINQNVVKTIEKKDEELKEDLNKVKLHKVIRVVDGDTVVIEYNGKEEKVRMIGVNTPESVDPRRKVECFGAEASSYTKSLLENKDVNIEFDKSQNERDKYGRLLLYIYLEDKTLINEKIIKDGFGYEYTYITPYKFQKEFKEAERHARESKLGLWADDACEKIKNR